MNESVNLIDEDEEDWGLVPVGFDPYPLHDSHVLDYLSIPL